MVKKYFLILVVILFFSLDVYALGISPSKIELDFQPNLKQEFEFLALNSVNVSFPVEVFVSGELEEYIDFEKQEIILEPFENRAFKFTLELPESFDKPGNHTVDLVVLQKEMIGTEEGGFTIGAVVSVRTPMIVFVPFDGPYVDLAFESRDKEIGEEVPFLVYMNNLGTEPVDYLKGEITIFNFRDEIVGTIFFEDSLSLGEEKQIILSWGSEGNTAGLYYAILKVNYSGESAEERAEFRLGSFFIDILDYQKKIEKGEINKYESVILSTWNDPLQNVYTQLDINYFGEPKIFKSESFEIAGWENKTVVMFVDSSDMEKGTYPAKLSVFYGNTSTSVNFDIDVIMDKSIIYISLGIVVLVIIGLIVLFNRRIKKRKNEGRRK